MAGGGATTTKPNASAVDKADAKATSTQAQSDATNAALFAQMLGNQKAIYDARATPSPVYYQPKQASAAQLPFVNIPGNAFGAYNPFYSPQQQPQGYNQAQTLTNAYNAYKANNANQMYNTRAAQMAQANAQQKAYQDAQAAAKAKAEADKARAQAEAAAAQQSGMFGAANGGIADLYRGY